MNLDLMIIRIFWCVVFFAPWRLRGEMVLPRGRQGAKRVC